MEQKGISKKWMGDFESLACLGSALQPLSASTGGVLQLQDLSVDPGCERAPVFHKDGRAYREVNTNRWRERQVEVEGVKEIGREMACERQKQQVRVSEKTSL